MARIIGSGMIAIGGAARLTTSYRDSAVVSSPLTMVQRLFVSLLPLKKPGYRR